MAVLVNRRTIVAASAAALVGPVASTRQAMPRERVSPDDFGGGGPGLLRALASLTSGGVLSLTNGATYTVNRGNGNFWADTIMADNITIEGNGATIHGLPATGVIANDRYNQFYNIFQATGRRGLGFRNLKVTGALAMASLYRCTNLRFDHVEDDGALAQGLCNVLTITGITQANPGTVTYTGPDPTGGDYYTLTGIFGMTELNDKVIRITAVNTGAKSFTLSDMDGNSLDTSAYTAYSSGGSAVLASNWLRDKSIYLDECDDVVVTEPTINNCAFGVYSIGNQGDAANGGANPTRCGTVKVIGGRFEIDAEDYTAFFPAAIYWVDVDDGLTQGCTIKNYYSSILNGNTGSGQGYGVYEGDGSSRSVRSVGDTFIFESSGGRAAACVYTSETDSFTLDSPTFDIQVGANVTALARLDAKRVDTSYVLKRLNAKVAAGVPCYGVYVVGASTIRAPDVSLSDSVIVGGLHALRVDFLGNGRYSTVGNTFRGQESTAGAVYCIGSATVPHRNISMRGDRITQSQGPNVNFAGYSIGPRIHGCHLLDANLVGATGDLASNVLLSASQGSNLQGNRIGNTVLGGGQALYGVTNSNNPADRVIEDIMANNTFVGLGEGNQLHRFAKAAPRQELFDLNPGDVI